MVFNKEISKYVIGLDKLYQVVETCRELIQIIAEYQYLPEINQVFKLWYTLLTSSSSSNLASIFSRSAA